MSQLARTAALELQVAELETRLHTLETTWKAAMEKERLGHEKQMAEVVQIVMVQQQLHEERTATLESRLEEAIKLCHDAASMHQRAVPSADSPTVNRQPTLLANAPSQQDTVTASSTPSTADQTDQLKLPTIPQRYQSRVDRIFDFYTAGDVLRPQMGMSAFCRMLRDCHVGELDSGTSPELLWMAVIRALHNNRSDAKELDDVSRARFTRERHETFGRERFPDALAVVAMELHRLLRRSVTVPAAEGALQQSAQDTCIVFLTGVIFPRTAEVMRRAGVANIVAASNPNEAVAHYERVIQTYNAAEDVKALLRQNASNMKHAFEAVVTDADASARLSGSSSGMTATGLSEIARRYKLLPHLSKIDIRAIFDCCAAWEHVVGSPVSAAHTTAVSDAQSVRISFPAFVKALCCMAERIYGDTAVASLYPTPGSRVSKLMTKMFVLS